MRSGGGWFSLASPLIAIVGRPNVGKSTLFNRLVGQRRAIVDATAGLTRDRLYGDTEWRGRRLTLVDTAGLDFDPSSDLRRQVGEQTRLAIREAELVLLVVDVRAGVLAPDREAAELLRRSGARAILVGNKAEGGEGRHFEHELYELGLGDPLLVSAAHGTGTGDLLDAMLARLPAEPEARESPGVAGQVAIVGRPNVGKSSLLNAILGTTRSVVDEEPGTTRDPVDTVVDYAGQRVLLLDTAGIRRRGAVGSNVEHYSLLRGLRAMQRGDVALLVLDAREGIRAQDQHIAGYAVEAGRGLVLVVNKCDLLRPEELEQVAGQKVLQRMFAFAPFAPVRYVSALRRTGTDALLPEALAIIGERQRRIPTPELNRFLERAATAHPPPTRRGRSLKLFYAVQVERSQGTPIFQIFVNHPELVHFSYRRYLEKQLRRAFGFKGTPLRLIFSARSARAKSLPG